jgi:hypothetical protein
MTSGNNFAIPTFYAKIETAALLLRYLPREHHAPTCSLGAVACKIVAYRVTKRPQKRRDWAFSRFVPAIHERGPEHLGWYYRLPPYQPNRRSSQIGLHYGPLSWRTGKHTVFQHNRRPKPRPITIENLRSFPKAAGSTAKRVMKYWTSLTKHFIPPTYLTLTGSENALKDVELESFCAQQLKDYTHWLGTVLLQGD